jgi:hypothetical protein
MIPVDVEQFIETHTVECRGCCCNLIDLRQLYASVYGKINRTLFLVQAASSKYDLVTTGRLTFLVGRVLKDVDAESKTKLGNRGDRPVIKRV